MTTRMTTRASHEARVRYGGAPAQLHAGKAYDIAGRPPVLRRRGNCSREQGAAAGRWSAVGHVHSRLWVSRGTGGQSRAKCPREHRLRVISGSPLCRPAFPQVGPTVRGEVRRREEGPLKRTNGRRHLWWRRSGLAQRCPGSEPTPLDSGGCARSRTDKGCWEKSLHTLKAGPAARRRHSGA